MADIVIETDRLLLRRIAEGDAELQYRLLNSPVLMEHLGGPKELHEIEAKHANSMALFARHSFGWMMMMEKATGDCVGHCGMKLVDNDLAKNPGDHEIGWIVREDRWRRGYALEAVATLIDWAFARHDIPHVVAMTGERNEPSWRLMERLGMQRREDLDFDDPAYPPEDRRTIIYAVSAEQWQEKQE
ncbi:GNAT family N-acetyltransferase [Erythrobacter sp. 3-20A1M]|uniref:GNAT family N-acetyltransferase n=1 Tax=Erythrobacter sp. 3-20A1M TaxID=2653850 RepID=UPI001BFC3EDB|nr:GNAT family N-acetyltransferase [Erythrobacter sp. 3-20A1M]QWC56820.1 GNAT family N-acetyltransferase [Erythrobacter sp. 3-20A1M]